jgi:putative phage-type endonuclease
MKIQELDQRSPEWLEFRKNKIGASDSPAIMGMSPWATPYQLWERKLGLDTVVENSAMKRGTQLEPMVRERVFLETGKSYQPRVVMHQRYPWMIASLDGLSEDQKGIIEIKCVNGTDHALAKLNMVPEKYQHQLWHQMEVCNMDSILYCSYSATYDELIIFPFFRDDKKIEEMIEKEKEFLICLEEFIPPALTEKDYETKNDNVWNETCQKWKEVKSLKDKYEEEEKKLRQDLIALTNSKNCIGAGVKVQKFIRRGSVDYSSIPALNLIDLDVFRKPASESWRVTCA